MLQLAAFHAEVLQSARASARTLLQSRLPAMIPPVTPPPPVSLLIPPDGFTLVTGDLHKENPIVASVSKFSGERASDLASFLSLFQTARQQLAQFRKWAPDTSWKFLLLASMEGKASTLFST